jgi:hypothetical protein
LLSNVFLRLAAVGLYSSAAQFVALCVSQA